MKVIVLRIPDAVAQYFLEKHGDLVKVCQALLNDALRSILEQEAPDLLAFGYASGLLRFNQTHGKSLDVVMRQFRRETKAVGFYA